jgi:hypothetical protein
MINFNILKKIKIKKDFKIYEIFEFHINKKHGFTVEINTKLDSIVYVQFN